MAQTEIAATPPLTTDFISVPIQFHFHPHRTFIPSAPIPADIFSMPVLSALVQHLIEYVLSSVDCYSCKEKRLINN